MAKNDPLKGNALNKISHFNARPINRDAWRVVEPSDPQKKRKKADSTKISQRGNGRDYRQPELATPRRQLVKKDGTVLEISYGKP